MSVAAVISAAVARTVILGSAKGADEYGWLQFDEPTYQPEFGCTCTFVRAGNETSVTFTMLDHYTDALLDFIDALKRPNPDSHEPRVWESEDSDLRLTVAGDGPHATVGCVMRWSPEWLSRDLGVIKVEAADLRSFAQQMRAFVSGP
jgi:hypothetical protein